MLVVELETRRTIGLNDNRDYFGIIKNALIFLFLFEKLSLKNTEVYMLGLKML
jgi:hypothetical protein